MNGTRGRSCATARERRYLDLPSLGKNGERERIG